MGHQFRTIVELDLSGKRLVRSSIVGRGGQHVAGGAGEGHRVAAIVESQRTVSDDHDDAGEIGAGWLAAAEENEGLTCRNDNTVAKR